MTLHKSVEASHLNSYPRRLNLAELGDLIPDLQFLDISFQLVHQGYHEFSRLTTLSVTTHSVKYILDCNFPSLMHFSLYPYPLSPTMNSKVFVDLPGVLGKNLITYHDYFPLLDHSIPDEAWLLCPNLERIRTGLRWSSSLQPPASDLSSYFRPSGKYRL